MFIINRKLIFRLGVGLVSLTRLELRGKSLSLDLFIVITWSLKVLVAVIFIVCLHAHRAAKRVGLYIALLGIVCGILYISFSVKRLLSYYVFFELSLLPILMMVLG